MKRLLVLLLLIAIVVSLSLPIPPGVSSDSTLPTGEGIRSYTLYRVTVSGTEDLAKLVNLGIDILGGRENWRDVLIRQEQLARFQALGLSYEPLILPQPEGQPTTDSFPSYPSMVAELTALSQTYPTLCKTYIIGYSFKGQPIWALKITKTPILENNRPRVLYVGTHHAREWMTLAVSMKLARYLVENYNTDPGIKALVNTRETWIVPLTNVDGYIYDTAGNSQPQPPGRMWRKDLRDNLQDDGAFSESMDGVDLNRNYPYQWGTVGTSHNPSDDVYCGPWSGSEPETQALRDLASGRPFLLGLSLHTYSNLVLYPWGYTSLPAPDFAFLSGMAADMAHGYNWNGLFYPGNGYTDQQASELYPTSGDTGDWFYGFLGAPFFTFEMTPDTFYEPASQITPTFNLNKDAMLYLVRRVTELTGAVWGKITDPGGNPLEAQVQITAQREANSSHPKTGYFSWTMVPGVYQLTVSASGYQTISDTVPINAGAYTRQDYALQPLEPASVDLLVRDQAGHPLPASVQLLEENRPPVQADPTTGHLALADLPPGRYPVKVSAYGFTSAVFDVTFPALQPVNVVLSSVNSLLLVDGGGWGQSRAQIEYYRQSLNRLGQSFDEWNVSQLGIPTLQQLRSYAQLLWFRPYGGLDMETQSVLRSYLDGGGRLILSGQDIALSSSLQGNFLETTLAATFQADDVAGRNLGGVVGDPVGDGLSLNLSLSGGQRDNAYVDAVTPTTGGSACFTYTSAPAHAGAVRIERSNSRTVFFSFNWEGISDPAVRDVVLSRCLLWNGALVNDPPQITSSPSPTATPSSLYTYTVTAIDPQGDPLSFRLLYHPAGMALSQTGFLSWTPTPGQAGSSFPVKLEVRDNKGGSFFQTFSLLVQPLVLGDFNEDGLVDHLDLFLLAGHWLTQAGSDGWDPRFDLNRDSTVNEADLTIFRSNWHLQP